MDDQRDEKPASDPDQDKPESEASEADKVAPDDRHKTEKLASHDGIDPNAGQE